MTRDEALLKLLRVEPETKDGLILVTGWPVQETLDVLDRLVAEKRVGYGTGPYTTGRRLYCARPEA